MPKKVAIGSWAYVDGPYAKNPMKLDKLLGELVKLKFDGISLCGLKPHAHPDLYPTKADRLRLRNLLMDNHIEVLEVVPDIWAFNPLTREKEYRAAVDDYIGFMDECGFHILRVDTCCPPILPDGVGYNQAMDKIVEIFKWVAGRCARHNIAVVWEFEPGFIFNKPSEVVKIVKAVDMPNFNLLFDTCHAYMCAVKGARQIGERETLKGGIKEFIGMVSGKIGIVHLIDSDGTLHSDDDTSTHSPFGTGFINFDEVIPAFLNEGKYEFDWWVIDLHLPDDWNVTVNSKKFVDAINAKYCP